MVVLAYIRVSTDEQAENGNSLFEQKERLTAYCRAMGWDEPIFYTDDGYSAKNTNRPDMTNLMNRIKKEQGGIVLTTKLDRLSRNLLDILKLNEYFEKFNFNYVSANEGFDTSTAAGRLVLQMLGMVAEFERERISENVRNNMISIAKNSKKVISRPCFGYDIVEGQMVTNMEEALLIRTAACELLLGKPARSVIKQWNIVENVRTKEGNEWHEKTFRELLQRETLIGEFVYNKTYKKGNKVLKRPEEEWVHIKDHHPAILDVDTFDKLQNLFKSRKSVGKHMSDDRYLLSGLVVCGHCKSKMNGKMYKNFSKKLNKENIHYKYICDGYIKKSKCFHHYIHRDDLESLIIGEVIKLSKSAPGSLEIVITKQTKSSLDIEVIKARLAKLDKKMQKQIDAYNEDLITAHDLKIATEKVEIERKELKNALLSNEETTAIKDQERLINKAKSSIDKIMLGDRIAIKQALRELVYSIEITSGSNVGISWYGD
ncbi:putative DNA-invertase from lambdoid prophage Rac [compost metagenome]